ncbi:MAG: TonB-dependent receptor [Williamsia sp.]|nr:TonB-dependent receptor [Williamsia sp.]
MSRLLVVAVFFLFPWVMMAQQRRITGSIVNKNSRMMLEGVTVKGRTTTTTSAGNGSFSLAVSDGETIDISHVGYVPQAIRITANTTELTVELVPAETAMDAVVITGYTTERKKDLTGSISVVNMGDVKNIPSASPLQSLQGRVPGMSITRDGTPGGSAKSVLIRGINTLGNNDPLYIIDGQPVDSRVMETLDPNDIESLQVLKDAASASIYGSRASNGVIIISTKKGRSGRLRVDVNTGFTSQAYATHLQMLNTDQRGSALWQASINDGTDPNRDNTQYTYVWHRDAQGTAILDKMTVNEWLDKTIQGGIRAGNTDWFKEVSRPGYLLRNNISLSSAGETHNLFMSVGHLANQGIIKYTGYEQLSLRLNTSFNALKGKLKVGENLQLTTTGQTPIGSGQGGTPLDLAILDLPIMPVYAENGSFAGPVGSGFSNRMNALQVSELSKDWKNRSKGVYGNVYLDFTPIANLTFRSSLGFNYGLAQEVRINPRYSAGFLSMQVNNYSNNLLQNANLTWFNTLNYTWKKKDHNASFLVGTEAVKNDSSYMYGYKEGFLIETPDYFQINAGTGLTSLSGSATGYSLLSYFSKINYSFKSRYLASLTLRADGSSRFGENNRYGFFPALSVGWRISDESFVQDNLGFVSQLMLRSGIGRTGNQKIANDATFGLFIPGYGLTSGRRNMGSAYDLNGAGSGTLPSGVIATQTANPSLKWESTDELNIGADFGFLQQKITGSFDYFSRRTNDILIKPPYLAVLGAGGSMWENGATMNNRGWELVAGYNTQVRDLNLRITGNISSFRDKIVYLPASVVRAYPGNVQKTIVGHSLSSMFGWVTDGIFQNQQEVDKSAAQPGKGIGRLRYRDLNGDGVIDVLDQDWLGNSIPDFAYGLNTVLNYKNFNLSFFFQGVQGIKYYNSVKNQSSFVGAFAGQNNATLVLNAWTPQHPNTNIPAVSNFDRNNEVRTSDFQIENASYLKLRNVQLGYSLPKGLQQKLRMTRADVYISGSELLTIKSDKYSAPDPENPGSFYPIPRSFTLGFNVSF